LCECERERQRVYACVLKSVYMCVKGCVYALGAQVRRGCTRFQIPYLLCLKEN